MLVIIRSSPDTPEGKRGVKIARDMSADIVLLQNGVYFLQGEGLEDMGFARTVYALEDDVRLRGLKTGNEKRNRKEIGYDGFIDLLTSSGNVTGMF